MKEYHRDFDGSTLFESVEVIVVTISGAVAGAYRIVLRYLTGEDLIEVACDSVDMLESQNNLTRDLAALH